MTVGVQPAFFPGPEPGEHLYSMVARYHWLAGNGAHEATAQNLFGRKTVTLTARLPTGVKTFFQLAGRAYWSSVEEFIDQHTLLAIVRPFTSAERCAVILEVMLSDSAMQRSPSSLSGLSPTRGPKDVGLLAFCVKCRDEEVTKHQRALWHCAHQAPWVDACWKHGCALFRRCPACERPVAPPYHWMMPPERCECGYRFSRVEVCRQSTVQYASFCHQLLTNRLAPLNVESRRRTYRHELRARGFREGTTVDRETLAREFDSYYGTSSPDRSAEKFGSALHGARVAALVRGHLRSDLFSIAELMLAAWLFQDVATFASAVSESDRRAAPALKCGSLAGSLAAELTAASGDPAKVRALLKKHRLHFASAKYLLHRFGIESPALATVDPTELKRILHLIERGQTSTRIASKVSASQLDVVAIASAYPEVAARGQTARLRFVRQLVLRRMRSREYRGRDELLQGLPKFARRLLYGQDRTWLAATLPSRRGRLLKGRMGPARSKDWDRFDTELTARLHDIVGSLIESTKRSKPNLSRLSVALGFRPTYLHRALSKLPRLAEAIRALRTTESLSTAA